MSRPSFTILIPARDAATTIERAVASAVLQRPDEILLLDHACSDQTVSLARRAAGDDLRVISVSADRKLGAVRQAGLQAIQTEYGVWLDADDELLDGRCSQLVNTLQAAGGDLAFDEIELVDGPSGAFLRRMVIPEFLRDGPDVVRCFERNYLPGLGVPGFRASFARTIGYDPGFHGAEDHDFLLRAVADGARIVLVREMLYRQFAYGSSVSRHLARQRASLAVALKKHEYEQVRARCRAAGQPERVAAWVLVSMALFRGEPGAALRFLEDASPVGADPREVLEPDGPWPFREGWRRAFQRGTCLALLGGRDEEAIVDLLTARSLEVTAEGENNLGVVLARVGRTAEARGCWEQALQRFPGYLDARVNLDDPAAGRITTHPLRRQASRSEY